MKFLKATYRVVTPMFLGEASDGQQLGTAKTLRVPSIKGALRFWWRALNWRHCLKAAHGNETNALKQLHYREATLFGLAADEEAPNGQGKFLMTISEVVSSKPVFTPLNGHQYLLGQGLFKPSSQGGELLRQPLEVEAFSLKFLFKSSVVAQERSSIAEAALLWGLLGGLGSRSRKGFGSVAIHSMEGCDDLQAPQLKVPKNADEFKQSLRSLLGDLPPGLPPFTAFSKNARIDVLLTGSDALNLLSRVGDEMQLYRSNGRGGFVERRGRDGAMQRIPAETTFRADHDLVEKVVQGHRIATLPERAVFGLPHNYYFSTNARQIKQQLIRANWSEKDAGKRANKLSTVEIIPEDSEKNRRASPLFIHSHRFSDFDTAIIASLLPAVFFPVPDRIDIKSEGLGGNNPIHVSGGGSWSVEWKRIHEFLNRFSGDKVVE